MTDPSRVEDAASLDIGRRLRSARVSAGLTLFAVAERTQLSEGFLSKLERGQASSSIANFIQITNVLGIGMHQLFAPDSESRTTVAVHRGAELESAEITSSGHRWRPLAGGAALDQMEVFHLILSREDPMKTMVSHPGQEHCYVLTGEILFHVGEAKHRLQSGDGIFINSELPHRAENCEEAEAHLLMTVTKIAHGPTPLDWWRLPMIPSGMTPKTPMRNNEEETR